MILQCVYFSANFLCSEPLEQSRGGLIEGLKNQKQLSNGRRLYYVWKSNVWLDKATKAR